MFFLATRMMANILYIRDGRIRLWIRPRAPPAVTILFWGPQELLLSRGKIWRFKDSELPKDLLAAMDAAMPMDVETILAPSPAVLDVAETKEEEEAPPMLGDVAETKEDEEEVEAPTET